MTQAHSSIWSDLQGVAFTQGYVNAGGVPQTSSYAVSVHVQVRQTLRSLVTESSVVDAMTWDSHTVLAVARNRMSPLRDMIARQIGLFVEDWKAVH